MVQSVSGYQSFSVLGMTVIFALGGFIIAMGLAVDVIAARFGPEWSISNVSSGMPKRLWRCTKMRMLQLDLGWMDGAVEHEQQKEQEWR
jgi:hypothetical protein